MSNWDRGPINDRGGSHGAAKAPPLVRKVAAVRKDVPQRAAVRT